MTKYPDFKALTDSEKAIWLHANYESFWETRRESWINGQEHALLIDIVQEIDIQTLIARVNELETIIYKLTKQSEMFEPTSPSVVNNDLNVYSQSTKPY